MGEIFQQNEDGSWSPTKPLPYMGWKARLEQFCYRIKLKRVALLLGRWDERGLG